MIDKHEVRKAAMREISRLVKEGGGKITPAALVMAAKDERSPLHGYFEWDDAVASDKYREMQARTLLRSCSVHILINKRRVEIPKYVRDPDVEAHEQGYCETAKIRSVEDAAHEVLVAEFARAASMVLRARRLAAYFELVEEFDDLTARMTQLKQRIEEHRLSA